jgi:integrase
MRRPLRVDVSGWLDTRLLPGLAAGTPPHSTSGPLTVVPSAPCRIRKGLAQAVPAARLTGPDGALLRVVPHQLRQTYSTMLVNAIKLDSDQQP